MSFFCLENELSPQNNFSNCQKESKPNNYTQNKKLIRDWTNKKIYLIHYTMFRFYVRHAIIVDKVIELI